MRDTQPTSLNYDARECWQNERDDVVPFVVVYCMILIYIDDDDDAGCYTPEENMCIYLRN